MSQFLPWKHQSAAVVRQLMHMGEQNQCLTTVQWTHRIIDDRIEKYDAYIVFISKQDCHAAMKRDGRLTQRGGSGVKGGGAVRYRPGAPSNHPYSPRPARSGVHMWSVGAAGPVQQTEQSANVDCAEFAFFILFSILSSIILWLTYILW